MFSRPEARRAAGAAITLMLLGLASARATTIDLGELMSLGWQKADGPIVNGNCNYMYVAPTTGELLYYGTSINCQTRRTQHESAVLTGRLYVNAYHEAIKQRLGDKQAGEILSLAEIELGKVTNQELYGDTCLTAASIRFDYQLYYIALTANPNAVEACVLRRIKGGCNRIGNGSPSAGWIAVKPALRECGASSR
jgi:hypothetical protein